MKASSGTWQSPITADLIASGNVRFSEVVLDHGDIYWLESRPKESGRSVIVRRTQEGKISDVTPPPFSVRTRVHEYGGGAYTVHSQTVYFSNFSDGRIYRQEPGSSPRPLTPERDYRYADLYYDQHWNRLIAVREDRTSNNGVPVNSLVSIEPNGSLESRVLVSGGDFYSNPRISPNGESLAFLTWALPNMPWDGTELHVAHLDREGCVSSSMRVAWGREESVFQPQWSPNGKLYYISDLSGWWNIYRVERGKTEPVCPMEAEFGLPQWVFGMSTYGFISEDLIIAAYVQKGIWSLAEIRTDIIGDLREINSPYTEITGLRAEAERAVFLGASINDYASIIVYDPKRSSFETLRREGNGIINRDYFSIPEAISYPTDDGLTAYGFFYPPRNPNYTLPDGELPPLIVINHSGPTAANGNALKLKIQFWTSRGFAVLDVNYRGSTGYGREYRRSLEGKWGIADVADCVNGVRYLIRRGDVDAERLIIRGSSAGGYTVLCALTFYNIFKAGASYYGISELESLISDSHKFESRYFDRLIGPYPGRRDLYLNRSPLNFAEKISCPVIFFQGLEDRVVPPEQASRMIDCLRRQDIPVEYIFFEGEGHGFRRAETIKRALEAELRFYLNQV